MFNFYLARQATHLPVQEWFVNTSSIEPSSFLEGRFIFISDFLGLKCLTLGFALTGLGDFFLFEVAEDASEGWDVPE